MKLARLTLSAPSVCMLLVFLAWILSILCIHFSHFAASIFRKSQSKQFRHFPKQTVEIVPTRTTMNVSERSYLSSMRLSPHLDKNAHYSGWVYRSIYIYIYIYLCCIFLKSWTQQKPVEAQVSTSISLTVYLNIIPAVRYISSVYPSEIIWTKHFESSNNSRKQQ